MSLIMLLKNYCTGSLINNSIIVHHTKIKTLLPSPFIHHLHLLISYRRGWNKSHLLPSSPYMFLKLQPTSDTFSFFLHVGDDFLFFFFHFWFQSTSSQVIQAVSQITGISSIPLLENLKLPEIKFGVSFPFKRKKNKLVYKWNQASRFSALQVE